MKKMKRLCRIGSSLSPLNDKKFTISGYHLDLERNFGQEHKEVEGKVLFDGDEIVLICSCCGEVLSTNKVKSGLKKNLYDFNNIFKSENPEFLITNIEEVMEDDYTI